MKKQAVLLSGGVNFQVNYKRYKNDLEFVYSVLLEKCGFQGEDITILYANGASLNYRNQQIQTKEASRENLIEALEKTRSDLGSEDEFVLVVSNHGGADGGGCINLWGDETFNLRDLSHELNQIHARKIILLGECYAGNILQYDIGNACVMTANMRDKVSYARPYGNDYDEFLYHFFAYIYGVYPDGAMLKQKGENNVKKAFQYAVDMDIFGPNNPQGNLIRTMSRKNCIEIPQMRCDIAGDIQL